MTKNTTVGIFDSGVGGLTVASAIVKQIPHVHVIYFGDSARVPYGNKSEENILAYSKECIEFLVNKGADIIVIACNTSSAIALNSLRKKFKHLPILGVIDPGVMSAITAISTLTKQSKKSSIHRVHTAKDKLLGITVAATFRTANSHIYRKKIQFCNPDVPVYEVSCPLLVPIIEEGMKNKQILNSVLENYLATVVKKSQVLLLGCTHYPLIKLAFKKTFPKIKIVDSAETTAYYLKELITNGKLAFDIEVKKKYKKNMIDGYVTESMETKIAQLPLAQITFTKNKNSYNKLKKGIITIFTSDKNEEFLAITKKLFPDVRVERVSFR